MAEEHPPLHERSLEDIAATQAEHTIYLARIIERLDGIETAIQLLAGNITNLQTELLVIKALIAKEPQSD